ncbi:MAG TPA: Lrp/AsnC family transcriptional regulator [Thermococcus sp.]|uniref:Lrp/AsnC family transcriptional regulator n=1 Tax=Thermococcus sp. TaxID=35749 RepID=UPI000F0FA4EB|nr:Lrp/AsnC family transcriptional regulator [Thermococcus sp.]MCD6140128.1 Lrp/AsnC family transcriptional regulator [Thermococcus sp.]RLF73109.1 MAG: transcriptional regulator [Thermococci archaeon]RLF81713.1 MAG: transcriptional regulator [Thermococci archaeon]HDH45599.1 Lrp/AsnC family transcriptional regulator [Thermococcus sp.]
MKNKIDKFDLQIMGVLAKNARVNYRQLAELLNTTRQRVARRLERLEREGTIKKYTIIPDFDKLGYLYVAIGISIKPGTSIEKIIETLKEDEDVKVIQRAIGYHQLIVHIVAPKNMKEIEKKIHELSKKIEGLEGMDLSFVTDIVKFELV